MGYERNDGVYHRLAIFPAHNPRSSGDPLSVISTVDRMENFPVGMEVDGNGDVLPLKESVFKLRVSV